TNWFARAWAARPDTAATALDLAAAQERLGEAALAEQTLRTAVDRCRDPLAPVKLANFLIRHDRLDEAETVLRQLLRREPHYALAHNSLGTVYLQRAEWAVAERELFSALAADPRLMLAHANLGVLYDRGGDWPRARAHFERARALAPDDAALRAVYAAARDRWEIAAPPSSSSAPANR
ncbi:tetratricopeptide repeat protein, partial [bacterium]|nr:tetratricopeptide repeat protein [bacterium]